MIVANSSGLPASICCSTKSGSRSRASAPFSSTSRKVSRPTPSLRAESFWKAGSMMIRVLSFFSDLRTERIFSSWAWFSARLTAHSACSRMYSISMVVESEPRGTSAAPMHCMARSATSHSGMLSETIPT